MNLNNNLPTFKGLAHERPIQFLNDFEIRATALVGNNDSLLLQTVQQVLFDAALTWFGQLQKTQDRITTWTDFKIRFYERYHTPAKVQSLRTELRLLFQGDNESTLDYFERLKTLMVEIDPECTNNWLKHKFIQKLRSDIRSRLDADLNLPIREIVRKAQNIESNIEQQKVDEKLKLAANQEKKNIPSLITNNLSINTNNRRRSSPSPTTSSSSNYNNEQVINNIPNPHNDCIHSLLTDSNLHPSPIIPRNNFNNSSHNSNHHRSNNNHQFNNRPHDHQFITHTNSPRIQHNNNKHNYNNNNLRRDNLPPNHTNNKCYSSNNYTNSTSNFKNHSNSYIRSPHPPSISSGTNNRPSNDTKTRWWCPHCQRHGHSWERCPANPDGINYRPTSSPQHPPLLTSNQLPSSSYSSSSLPVTSTTSQNNYSHSEN
jgi:hypothetical protein